MIDAEIISDETVFTPTPPDLPFSNGPLGWCNDRLHTECPGWVPPHTWADPARKGATYTSRGRRCPCACHTRPVR